MQELQCEAVTPLYAAALYDGELLICMKLAALGNLYRNISCAATRETCRRPRAYPPLQALIRWAAQIAAGLEGMHMCCVVYCDLKARLPIAHPAVHVSDLAQSCFTFVVAHIAVQFAHTHCQRQR